MASTATLGVLGDGRQWMRTVVVAAVALLVVALPGTAGAEGKNDPGKAATTQASACEALGGEAEVGVDRNQQQGLHTTSVTCKGGWLDGMWCINDSLGSLCGAPRGRPDAGSVTAPLGGVVAALETGSPARINTAIATFEAKVNATSVTREGKSIRRQGAQSTQDDDQDQDGARNRKSKGKGQHGKKDGKHRKR